MLKENRFLLLLVLLAVSFGVYGQQKPRYPSLLWEITGNGLNRPSYLFGTMHVSSKMVFHLSDSFYMALKGVDAVALELNPETWQGEMVNLNRLKQNYGEFVKTSAGGYLTEQSFRIGDYVNKLKSALSSEPTIVNSLLYRSYKAKEDFEEDTFLDLYIYQTGKKLGKRAAGVENYVETEKLIMEAYADMAREKKKRNVETDGESRYDLIEKTQDAYRKGNLDLMDSLDRMMDRSAAFIEKFLFKRNEIQAHSIDTIVKNSSLFAAVGAAHLPGPRGIIEILRAKGYTLRPIQMTDRDADQKESIDKLNVPVSFTKQTADDGFYTVDMPGPLFKLSDDYQGLDRRQYADMANGAYYLVTRVKTYAAFLGMNEKEVMNKVDSFLYENIPGKIIEKKELVKNGYTGYNITNRTRRGDLQRYNIFVTPYEILVFKMSGKQDYATGAETEQFFNSIQLKEVSKNPVVYRPPYGEFTVKLPQKPFVYLNKTTSDKTDRWEYEATDPMTGDGYLILKKSIHNFRFIESDSFDLQLIEASFRNPDEIDKQLARKFSHVKGFPALDIKEKMKDGTFLNARFIIRGPHYYVIAAKTKNKKNDFNSYFNSFGFVPFQYPHPKAWVDTFMHFTVQSANVPEFDEEIRALAENTASDMASGNNASGFISYWPKVKTGSFVCEQTGEKILVNTQEYPRYYYVTDTSKPWVDDVNDLYERSDMMIYQTDTFQTTNGIRAFRFTLRDTGSSRTIIRLVLQKDNYRFSVSTMGDTLSAASDFVRLFFNSFDPEVRKLGRDIYTNRVDEFFADLFSKDSITARRARQSLTNVKFTEADVSKIVAAINRLNFTDRDYFDTKSKLIGELGYINDSTRPAVVEALKKIFEQTADTSIFQNEVCKALARHKTAAAYKLLAELLLQDPPIFSDSYAYNSLFRDLRDSLPLAGALYPGILQLATLADYKEHVLGLLVRLVDSGLVKGADYEDFFTTIYFDAKVELKRQQVKDEKIMEKELLNEEGEKSSLFGSYNRSGKTNLENYSVLLLPFYGKNKNVNLFFNRLLQSREPEVRLAASILLLKDQWPVADSILYNLAADDRYRSKLYSRLEKMNRLDAFPRRFNNQADMARSLLLADKNYSKVDSVEFIKIQPASYLDKKGVVYYYKYRVTKEDDWKMGISGLQPAMPGKISTENKLTVMTDKRIKPGESVDEQFWAQLRKKLYSFHKSAKEFFSNGSTENFRAISTYGD